MDANPVDGFSKGPRLSGQKSIELDNGAQGKTQDEMDMARMGKRQQTRRNFGLIACIGLTTSMMSTWESVLAYFGPGFTNAGPAQMFYGYIFAFIGSLATCLSLAEMASMYPITGAQYFWVALLAPPRYSKFLSWFTGWVSCIGWQANTASGIFIQGTIIQGLITLNNPNYNPQKWQGTLLLYAVLLLTVFVNSVMARFFPALEGLILILHVLGFFAIMIPLLCLAPMSSSKFVFATLSNTSGYSNDGVSWFVGLISSALIFVGFDGACHMAEEIRNASVNVPRSLIITMFINGLTGFAMVIVVLFSFGNVDKTLNTPTNWPFIEIFRNATQSDGAATAMVSLVLSTLIFGNFGFFASSSRQVWAFSRDRGLPGSSYLSRIDKRSAIPLWAIGFTGVISTLLGLINIASTTAFNALLSLVVAGFFSSYITPIICLMIKRVRKERIDWGPWTLGRAGFLVNLVAVVYLVIVIVFSFFPPKLPVTANNMNWSCLMFSVTMISGLIFYALVAHKQYKGPLREVEI